MEELKFGKPVAPSAWTSPAGRDLLMTTNASSLRHPSIAVLFWAMTTFLLSHDRGATQALTLRPPRLSMTNGGRPVPWPSTEPAASHLMAKKGSDDSVEDAGGPVDGAGRSVERRRVVVVGGGVGGLAVASRIASSSSPAGFDVVVLEKNPREDMLGGRCGSFDVTVKVDGGLDGTFRHERGPSLLLLRDEYERLFRDCGYDAARFGLVMERCVPAYQVVFDDGDSIEVGFPRAVGGGEAGAARVVDRDVEEEKAYARSRAKMNSLEPEGARKWDEYMEACSAFLNCGLPNFIEERLDLPSFPAFLREALRGGGKFWPLKPHSDVLDATFESEKMRTMASFQDLYVGLEPYRNDGESGRNPISSSSFGGGVWRKTAPAVFGLLAALELHPTNARAGVFAPIGGFRAVGEALSSLAKECGVDLRLGATATRICEEGVYYQDGGSDDKGDGTSDDESTTEYFLAADLVVVNADVPYATKCLLSSPSPSSQSPSSHLGRKDPGEVQYDWDDSFDFSCGVVAFHWSIDRVLDELNTHNVFLAATNRTYAEGSWRVLRGNGEGTMGETRPGYGSVEPFNFYVHRPSKTDPTAAPPGCDSITILVPCRALRRDEDCASLPRRESLRRYGEQFDNNVVDGLREAVLSRLAALQGLEGLKSSILHEVVDTPRDYADMYNVGAGVPFGLSHGFGQLSLTRPSAESDDFRNVLFVGASSRPGNGVPLVLIGAKSVADKALAKMKFFAAA